MSQFHNARPVDRMAWTPYKNTLTMLDLGEGIHTLSARMSKGLGYLNLQKIQSRNRENIAYSRDSVSDSIMYMLYGNQPK